MDYFVKQAKTGISPSLFQCSPSQFLYNPSYTCLPIEVTDSPEGGPFLDVYIEPQQGTTFVVLIVLCFGVET